MISKKGQAGGFGWKKIITLVLIVLVVGLGILGIWKFGLIERLREVFPDFNRTLEDVEVVNLVDLQEQQKNIFIGEKDPSCSRPYKEIKMVFDTILGFEDTFKFRYNDNLNLFQIYVNINGNYNSEEWLVHPDLFEMFKNKEKMYEDEIAQIEYIISSVSKDEFAKKLVKVSEDKNWHVVLDSKNAQVEKQEVLDYMENSKEKANFEKNKEVLKNTRPECFRE